MSQVEGCKKLLNIFIINITQLVYNYTNCGIMNFGIMNFGSLYQNEHIYKVKKRHGVRNSSEETGQTFLCSYFS